MPWYLGNSRQWWGGSAVVIPIAVWSLAWTGVALWHAARREEKGWFVFFLLVHTAGVAEILYLVFVANAFVRSQKSPRKKK